MNKLAIPAILAATVMVAGLFAFAPVQTASTVHNTVTEDYDSFLDLMCDEWDGVSYDSETGLCQGMGDL